MIRSALIATVVCVLACCAVASNASAQQQPKPLLPVLEQAQRWNWMVRLEDGAGHATQGRIVDRSDTLVRVGHSEVDLRNVQQVLRGSRKGGASMPAAIVGGGLLGGFGLALTSGFCERSDCSGQVILGTAFFAGFGFFIGLLLGEAMSPAHLEWKQVWP
jgi:hypothetical protein